MNTNTKEPQTKVISWKFTLSLPACRAIHLSNKIKEDKDEI